MDVCYPDRSWTARKIVSYLSRHPDAQETLDNIVRHCMPEGKNDRFSTLVHEVLGDLVTQGLIEKVQKEGQEASYRMHPGRR